MISLAKVRNGVVIDYFNGTENDLNYGSNSPEEDIIVHFPLWAKEIRQENERLQTALRTLAWNYETKEFIIKDFTPNWEAGRQAHANRTREIRNKMLVFTDWIETTDRLAPELKEKMLDYRQKLRDSANCTALSNADGFEEWCTVNNREPFPMEFIPEQDDTIKSFFVGLELVF